jgi:carbonyl reductase 1
MLQNVAREPYGEQAEKTLHVNYFSMLNTCHTLFPLLLPHARVVNLSSSDGHLATIPGEKLREQLSSPTLTEEQLSNFMKQFIEFVYLIYISVIESDLSFRNSKVAQATSGG